MDYADEQHGGVAEEMPPKIKAEENPWYLLATLYGVPEQSDRELREKNRIAWNRYFAANFNEATRARLIEEKRHPQNELNPFQRHELEEIKEAYLKRCASSPKHYPFHSAMLSSIFRMFNSIKMFLLMNICFPILVCFLSIAPFRTRFSPVVPLSWRRPF